MKTRPTNTVTVAEAKGTKRPVLPIAPEQFPSAGMVALRELSSHSGMRGMFPGSPDTWCRMVDRGEAPEPVRIGRVHYWHAQHVRAVAAGLPWQDVNLVLPELKASNDIAAE